MEMGVGLRVQHAQLFVNKGTQTHCHARRDSNSDHRIRPSIHSLSCVFTSIPGDLWIMGCSRQNKTHKDIKNDKVRQLRCTTSISDTRTYLEDLGGFQMNHVDRTQEGFRD